MKLWWPHNEIIIASLMIYRDTGDEKYLDWFEKTLDYCKAHFSDPEYGEWYGYLRRDGKPTMPACKGSTFKGPFHLPRMLIHVRRDAGAAAGQSGPSPTPRAPRTRVKGGRHARGQRICKDQPANTTS